MPVINHRIGEFVGCTIYVALLEYRCGISDCESVGVMITTGVAATSKFKAWCAAKLILPATFVASLSAGITHRHTKPPNKPPGVSTIFTTRIC
jgi:hypothetical protein